MVIKNLVSMSLAGVLLSISALSMAESLSKHLITMQTCNGYIMLPGQYCFTSDTFATISLKNNDRGACGSGAAAPGGPIESCLPIKKAVVVVGASGYQDVTTKWNSCFGIITKENYKNYYIFSSATYKNKQFNFSCKLIRAEDHN